jgi:hypothetical protein
MRHLFDKMPHIAEAMSHLFEKMPHIAEAMPHLFDDMPHIAEAMPHLFDKMPHIAEAMSHLFDDMPHIGTQWIPAGTNILYDAEGNDYTIGNFGDAGTWMTQNLQSTEYADGETKVTERFIGEDIKGMRKARSAEIIVAVCVSARKNDIPHYQERRSRDILYR